MNNKNKTLIMVVGVLLVMIMGVSFAYFLVGVKIEGNGGNTNIQAGGLPLVQYITGDNKLEKNNFTPKDIIQKNFKIKVTPTKDIKEVTYRIYLKIDENTFEKCDNTNFNEVTNNCELDAQELIYRFKNSSGEIIKEGDLTGVTGEIDITRDTKIQEVATEYEYKVEIEFVDTNKDQNHNINKVFNGEIKVEFAAKEQTVNDIILGLNAKTEQPDFSQVATTDEGVYKVEDGMYGGYSYYWRGAVTNNYVKFGGFCWRIIRINGDGSMRLIYDGATCHANGTSTSDSIAVASTAYNTSYNNSSYVGWTYSTGSQRTLSGTATGSSFNYAGYKRLYTDYAPTLSCNSGDVYTLKVGLITADEVEFAGGKEANNTSYYLYNGQAYWTMSPSLWDGSGARVFLVRGSDGYLYAGYVDGTYGLRPVINLKADTLFATGGNGTQSKPYELID